MRFFRILCVGVPLCIAALAGIIAFGTAKTPRLAQAVMDPFRSVDYSDLPPLNRYSARDGVALSYREYQPPGAGTSVRKQVAVLIHGSAADSQSMPAMARVLRQDDVTVFVPDLRGHGANQPHGNLRYTGRLDDDLTDFVQLKRPQHASARWTLIGFSSGGGFALRFDGGPNGNLFDLYLLLSPFLSYNGPTQRPATESVTGRNGSAQRADIRSFAVPYTGRIIGLLLLNQAGIRWFLMDCRYWRLLCRPPQRHWFPHIPYAYSKIWHRGPTTCNIHEPSAVIVGQEDEFSVPEQFGPVFHSQRPDVGVKNRSGNGPSRYDCQPRRVAGCRGVVQRKRQGSSVTTASVAVQELDRASAARSEEHNSVER
jgi:non-heme chloroperoxidase